MSPEAAMVTQMLERAISVAKAGGTQVGAALDELPAPTYLTNKDGVITHYNRACIPFAGRTPALKRDKWCVTSKLYTPEGRPLPHAECPMAITIRERRPIRGAEAVAERPDGSRIGFRAYPTPLFDEEENLTGAVNLLVPTTTPSMSTAPRARKSCLANRIESNIALSPEEHRVLSQLETNEIRFRRKSCIRHEGDSKISLYVLKEGWVMCSAFLPSGRRQITRLHFPGDIVGLPSIAMSRSVDTLTAATNVTLSKFDRAELGRIFVEYPRLASILFIDAQEERVRLIDRVVSLGRTPAQSRIAAAIVRILDRLSLTDPEIGNVIPWPLSQEDVGDLTGMTPIHVNRSLQAMTRQRLLNRERGRMTLLDVDALRTIAELPVRQLTQDLDWLPASTKH